jgi:hypothetical protein
MSYLARARAVRVEWDDREADRLLDAALDRIGRSCDALPDDATFWSDTDRADREEAVNVAMFGHDRAAFGAALAELQRYCLAAYGPPTGPEARP